jgi:hypothetical protein
MAYGETLTADQVPPYYSQIRDQNGQVRFQDFEDRSIYDKYAAYVESASSRNFVIDFGEREAWAAFNVGQQEIDGLLGSEVRSRSIGKAEPMVTVCFRDLRRCQRDGCKYTGCKVRWVVG